jgi:hypothetical protein
MRAAFLVFALILPAAAQTADYGAVHGTVLNADDPPLPNGQVQLTSREEDFSAKVGPDGRFALHARPGIYSLKIIRPGIIPFQRAQIVVRAGSVVNLNVRPVFDEPDPGVHYYSFAVPGVIELGAVLRHVDHGPYDMMLTSIRCPFTQEISSASPAPCTAPPPATRASKSARKTASTATAPPA